MPSRSPRIIVALVAGVALLGFIGWLDGTVMLDAQRDNARFFRASSFALALSLGYLVVAAGVLVVGLVVRWAQSLWVGIGYATAGAVFTFLGAIYTGPAGSVVGEQPLLPAPIVQVVANVYTWSAGPLGAVGIIGAAMLLAGLVTIGLEVRGRRTTASPQPLRDFALREEQAPR